MNRADLVEHKEIAIYLEERLGFARGRLYVEGTHESGLPGQAILRVSGVPRLTDEEHAAIAAYLDASEVGGGIEMEIDKQGTCTVLDLLTAIGKYPNQSTDWYAGYFRIEDISRVANILTLLADESIVDSVQRKRLYAMTTVDKSKRTFRIKLREVSGEKRIHMEVCNAEDIDSATAYARAKLGPTGLVLESVWEVDPMTGKKIE